MVDIVSLLILIIVILFSLIIIFFIINLNDKRKKVSSKGKLSDSSEILMGKNVSEEKVLFKNAKIGYRAVVLCSPDRKFDKKRLDYQGQKDCRLFVSMYDGVYDCVWGCIGFGNCKKRCPRNAISIVNSTAVVQKSCIGCGLCVESCPQQLIKLLPFNTSEYATCSYPDGNNPACSQCNKVRKLNSSTEKDFKFWKGLYKLIYGKRSGK